MVNLAYSTLARSPHLYEDYIRLIEKSFQYQSPNSFAVDFAPLVCPMNFEHCHLLALKGQVIGTIAVRKRLFGCSNSWFPVVCFGGIAIDESYQGQGHFKAFFQSVLDLYQDSTFYFLWSDLSSLYEKFSFVECGALIETGKRPYPNLGTSFRQLASDQQKKIKSLFTEHIQNRYLCFQRGDREWEDISSITSTQFCCFNDGYAVHSKGQDLPNIIHEFAFENDQWIRENGNFQIWASEEFNKIFHKNKFLYAGFIRAGSLEKVNAFFAAFIPELNLTEIKQNRVLFNFKNQDYNLLQIEFFQGIFGPNRLKEFDPYNLNIYIPGLDCV